MSPERAEQIFWQTHADEPWPVDQPHITQALRHQCWRAVISEMRKDFEVEMERLREENRELKGMLVNRISEDAGPELMCKMAG